MTLLHDLLFSTMRGVSFQFGVVAGSAENRLWFRIVFADFEEKSAFLPDLYFIAVIVVVVIGMCRIFRDWLEIS